MGALVGDPAKDIDWLVQPGKGIVGDFRARYKGAAWIFPDGTTAWLTVTDPKGCGEKRYEFTITANRLYVEIPQAEAVQIQDRAKFRVYVWYPGEAQSILWGVGKGVRDGW